MPAAAEAIRATVEQSCQQRGRRNVSGESRPPPTEALPTRFTAPACHGAHKEGRHSHTAVTRSQRAIEFPVIRGGAAGDPARERLVSAVIGDSTKLGPEAQRVPAPPLSPLPCDIAFY